MSHKHAGADQSGCNGPNLEIRQYHRRIFRVRVNLGEHSPETAAYFVRPEQEKNQDDVVDGQE